MAGLSQPRVVYGIHTATFYDPKTQKQLGMLRVLGNGTFTLEGETIELRGGSSRFAWSIQDGNVNARIEINTKEYPDFLFELFLGKKPTKVLASPGAVTDFKNVNGDSILDAATGIVAVIPTAGDEADLKFTKYTIVAVSATTVDIYASSNIDFANGNAADFENDELKINASPITIVTGANLLAAFGLTFTGSAAPAFTVGDTASFEVMPPSSSYSEVTIGGLADVFPEFGCVLYTQKLGSEEMFEIDVFKCKAIGLNLGAQEKAFSETPISAKAFYDAVKKGICKIRAVSPS